jgi:hypothetical protein
LILTKATLNNIDTTIYIEIKVKKTFTTNRIVTFFKTDNQRSNPRDGHGFFRWSTLPIVVYHFAY